MKICKTCKINKAFNEYYKYSDGYLRGACKDCLKKEDYNRRHGIPFERIKVEPWNKGKTNVYSDSQLQKMSESQKGKKQSEETIKKRILKLAKSEGRKSYKAKQWALKVKEKDNWKCVKCNCSEKELLHAHHIVPWYQDASLRFDLDNGMTLCRSCHSIEECKVNSKRKTSWSRGKKLSDEHRKKLSDAHKGKTPWNKGLKMKKGDNHDDAK